MSETIKTDFIKRAKGAVVGYVAAFLQNFDNKATNTRLYGHNNLLPNELISYVADSGVAIKASSKFAEYISAGGFTDLANAKLKVNDKQTADQVLQEVSTYFSLCDGAALHIGRTGGIVSRVKVLPFQCVRKKMTGGFTFNESLGQKNFKKDLERHYPEYVEGELTDAQITSKVYDAGEILYIYRKSPLNSFYPVPDYYGQIEDIRTSSELARFDLETVTNGFATSAIFQVPGNVDDEKKDDDGKTAADYIREDFKAFTGQVKGATGVGGRNKAMLHFIRTKEEAIIVDSLNTKDVMDASISKREANSREVARLWGVNPVLIGYSDAAVLGNDNALANASKELNNVVNPYQRLIAEAFEKMFPGKDWTISEFTPINYIPTELLKDMTEDERREKLLGLQPKEVDATGEAEATIKALNSLSPLVANKVLESMTPAEIRALVKLKPIEEPTTPPTV